MPLEPNHPSVFFDQIWGQRTLTCILGRYFGRFSRSILLRPTPIAPDDTIMTLWPSLWSCTAVFTIRLKISINGSWVLSSTMELVPACFFSLAWHIFWGEAIRTKFNDNSQRFRSFHLGLNSPFQSLENDKICRHKSYELFCNGVGCWEKCDYFRLRNRSAFRQKRDGTRRRCAKWIENPRYRASRVAYPNDALTATLSAIVPRSAQFGPRWTARSQPWEQAPQDRLARSQMVRAARPSQLDNKSTRQIS